MKREWTILKYKEHNKRPQSFNQGVGFDSISIAYSNQIVSISGIHKDTDTFFIGITEKCKQSHSQIQVTIVKRHSEVLALELCHTKILYLPPHPRHSIGSAVTKSFKCFQERYLRTLKDCIS